MKIKSLILILIIITLTSCKKDHLLDCFKSAGNTKTENRSTSSFTNIDLKNNVDLVIRPNSPFYIKVTAGENLIDGIITELNGNTLYIRNENRCNWMRSFKNIYTVEIGMPQPESIVYDGSGNISCLDTIRSDEFTFDCSGGSGSIDLLLNCNKAFLKNSLGRSDIHAVGFTKDSYIYMNDVGTLDASNLESNFTFITNISTGDCRLNVINDLGFEIKYTGNIYYTGNPHFFKQEFTGTGKLIHY